MRKQQQLGENKKIRLWPTGNSYHYIINLNFSWHFHPPPILKIGYLEQTFFYVGGGAGAESAHLLH